MAKGILAIAYIGLECRQNTRLRMHCNKVLIIIGETMEITSSIKEAIVMSPQQHKPHISLQPLIPANKTNTRQ